MLSARELLEEMTENSDTGFYPNYGSVGAGKMPARLYSISGIGNSIGAPNKVSQREITIGEDHFLIQVISLSNLTKTKP